jgi:hypothetical protein
MLAPRRVIIGDAANKALTKAHKTYRTKPTFLRASFAPRTASLFSPRQGTKRR